MRRKEDQDNRKGGFALIIVLFSLVTITALFATAQKRSLARLHDVAAEMTLLSKGQIERDLLDLSIAILADAETNAGTVHTISVDGQDVELRFQDVSGLIDLNTGSSDLLLRLADHFNLPASAIRRYRQWRQTPHRLLRVDDFLRITDADPGFIGDLRSIATVHSGRTDIVSGVVPSVVRVLMGAGDVGAPTTSLPGVPSATNYQVSFRHPGTGIDTVLGVLHIAPDPKQSRILQMF